MRCGACAGTQAARKRRDVALILPDFSARISVLDFDQFPTDPKEQASLIRFRLKRSVPFDVESAAHQLLGAERARRVRRTWWW